MAETWNARSGTGAACGPGTRRPLLLTASSVDPDTQALDATGHTWNRTESARTIAAGNWQVLFWCATGSGGGPANKVRVQVHRRDSSCAILQTILDEEVAVNKGTTEEYATTAVDPGAVAFASGEILTVIFIDSAGNQTKTLRFDATSQSGDTRLVHPVEAAPPVEGDLAATEAADAAAASGTVEWIATLSATEAVDAGAGSGVVEWNATLAATEGQDAFAASGEVLVEGDLAATEAADAAAATGTAEWIATIAATDLVDAAAGAGVVEWIATLAATEGQDAFSATGEVLVEGDLAATEPQDIFAASGEVETEGGPMEWTGSGKCKDRTIRVRTHVDNRIR